MIHPSEKLRAFVANHTVEEIKAWSLKRLHGEDISSMIYYGKEAEKPHEAVAAAFVLPLEMLTPDKRSAIVDSMRNVRRELEDSFLDSTEITVDKNLCDRWSEVIDLARPPELQKEARFLLRAAQEALPKTRSLLPALAAAATAYADKAELDSTLWRGLLRIPETAALAFQRLLRIESFEELADVWLELFRKRCNDGWPTNMRLLTLNLLNKATRRDEAIKHISKLLSRDSIATGAKAELESSSNTDLQNIAQNINLREHCFDRLLTTHFDRFLTTVLYSIVEDDDYKNIFLRPSKSSWLSKSAIQTPLSSSEIIDFYAESESEGSHKSDLPTFGNLMFAPICNLHSATTDLVSYPHSSFFPNWEEYIEKPTIGQKRFSIDHNTFGQASRYGTSSSRQFQLA